MLHKIQGFSALRYSHNNVLCHVNEENMSMSMKTIPLEPHFYVEKLGLTGVYLFFLFLFQNIDCGYSLEPPRRGGSNESPQSIF